MSQLKLRYIIDGTHYIPQFYNNTENKWMDFKVEHVQREMLAICRSLGDLQLPSRWGDGQWYYESGKQVFFTKEMFVMAFLGAASVFYNSKLKEFNLQLCQKEK